MINQRGKIKKIILLISSVSNDIKATVKNKTEE